eukprot:CAMPEP_0196599334 /NCGR_PEP_ID=MMETSP1081-20130531/94802_1 /TAXON_ID=36882 /ORGANISM="Pyramimonas amylifera, Strain CCMP720" /LENGTH=32 /DNA_ID= /DNA_START= /DNA_END= /DNA_ORIENTATION=
MTGCNPAYLPLDPGQIFSIHDSPTPDEDKATM